MGRVCKLSIFNSQRLATHDVKFPYFIRSLIIIIDSIYGPGEPSKTEERPFRGGGKIKIPKCQRAGLAASEAPELDGKACIFRC